MSTRFEELDGLSSEELRRRAFRLAERRLDLKFLWNVLEMIPAAEVAEGRPEKVSSDVESTRLWLDDYLRPGHPIDDAMRPVYIDYLSEHGQD